MATQNWFEGRPTPVLDGNGNTVFWFEGQPSPNIEEPFAGVDIDASADAGIASAESFGTGSLSGLVDGSAVAGIASAESFGTGSVEGSINGTAGIATGEDFGTGSLEGYIDGSAAGIASGESFGVGIMGAFIDASGDAGISSDESFGVGEIASLITGNGIASAESFGIGSLAGYIDGDAGAGISSGESFGTGYVTILLDASADAGIASAESFGTGSLKTQITGVLGIASGEDFGRGYLADDSVPAPNGSIFQVSITNVPKITCTVYAGVRIDSIQVDTDVNFNGRASFELIDTAGNPNTIPATGSDVVIKCFNTATGKYERIFAGQIDRTDLREEVGPGVRTRYDGVSCIDYGSALARRVINAKFPAAQYGTVNSILAWLDQNYLIQEGIRWEVSVDPGIDIGDIEFNGARLNEVLNRLMELTGCSWSVDYDKVLHTSENPTPVDETTAPFDITYSNKDFRSPIITKSRGLYRNRQIVKGSYTRTSTRNIVSYVIPHGVQGPPNGEFWQYFGTNWNITTQSFDTIDAVFLNDERWRNKVSKVITVKRNGVEEPFYRVVGTPLAPEGEIPANWKWNFFGYDMTMVYNMTGFPGTFPTAGDVMTIEFDVLGDLPQPVIVEDAVEIAARKAIEGGSGIYEDIVELPDISDADTLREYAEGLLARFGRIGVELTYETDTMGVMPGMSQQVTLPNFGVTESMTIESISMREEKGILIRNQVRASSILQQRDAMTAFRRLIERMRRANRGTANQITFVLAQDIPGLTNPGLEVGTNVTNTYALRQAFTLKECAIIFQQEPAGGDIEIDIKANGTSIFATGQRPVYSGGQQVYTTFTNPPLTLPAGTELTLDVISIGLTTPGKNGTVTMLGWV